MMAVKILVFLSLFYWCNCASSTHSLTQMKKPAGDGLYLVHVLCRHGNRTPRVSYAKDPHKKERFYPVGFGQLTMAGKKLMYNIGIALKKRYQEFLGNFYLPWQVKIRASSYDRTQMTAQLVMAGMYPPKTAQIWNKNLTWQPISLEILPYYQDKMFLAEHYCPRLMKLQKESLKNAKDSGKFDKYEYVFKNLREHTGQNVQTTEDVAKLYDILFCQKQWGLKLPSWADDYFMETMKDVSKQYWDDYLPTTEMKKLSIGLMLKKMVDDTQSKIKGDSDFEQMKFYLYAGHDANLVAMLQTLGIFDGELIPYGAYIAIEIHKKNKEYFVKVFYQDNKQENPKLVRLDGCSSKTCKFNDFVNNFKKYFPSGDDFCN